MIKSHVQLLLPLLFVFGVMLSSQAQAQSDDNVKYVPATHENLSRLFWKFNEYSPHDKEKVSDFLKTEECQLYAKYHLDDFAWENIVTGASRNLELFAREYPTHMEIVTIVFLDRYDFDRRAFRIESGFALENEGAVVFPFAKHEDLGCPFHYTSQSFSPAMKFSPENRFLLTHIPVYPEDADALLERLSKYNYPIVNERGVRALMGRIRLKIDGVTYNNVKKGAIFSGRLEEIAFFEDPAMTKPVWVKSLRGIIR